MRIAILCNGKTLVSWQRRAIELVAGENELFLLVCDDPPTRRQPWRHGLYYLLNLVTIRNRQTRAAPFPGPGERIAGRLDFVPEADGSWAKLPEPVLTWIAGQRIDAIVKFGLNLLRVPPLERLTVPILSYHHGDPRAFRGRPAGFHELLAKESYLGQVVQILSNELDSGEVLAFAQSRAALHSYRRTLIDAYALSPLLLPKALEALGEDARTEMTPGGRNYRLPSNMTVLRFVARMAGHFARRLAYGAFVEKKWRVSVAELGDAAEPCQAIRQTVQAKTQWRTLSIRSPHRFHADPFFFGNTDRILLEAMNGRSGKGELLSVTGDAQRLVCGFSGHISYPATVSEGGRHFILPEVCGWSRPAIFDIGDGRARHAAHLDIDEQALIDPTPLRHEGHLYLFANRLEEGPSVLRLWVADGLFGRFRQHPASPARISVRGGRMAGPVRRWPAGLVRIGQDLRSGYGDGVVAFRILELTPEQYREEEIGAASFGNVRGPHTLDALDGKLLFDWYEEGFSPLAGLRRLMGRL